MRWTPGDVGEGEERSDGKRRERDTEQRKVSELKEKSAKRDKLRWLPQPERYLI